MGTPRKTLEKILLGRSDANISFRDLRRVVRKLGFDERIEGDHHIYCRDGIAEIINLQPLHDGKAKPYQVRQVRNLILRYDLELSP